MEWNYSQLERESSAVEWECEHFHLYLYKERFTVFTDHKLLVGIKTLLITSEDTHCRMLSQIAANRK